MMSMDIDREHFRDVHRTATERYANCYHDLANQSYDFSRQKWKDVTLVRGEQKNLEKAASYQLSFGNSDAYQQLLWVERELLVFEAGASVEEMEEEIQSIESDAQKIKEARQLVQALQQELERDFIGIAEAASKLTSDRSRSYLGEVGVGEDADESPGDWTKQDRDLYLELTSLLHKVGDPLKFAITGTYSPVQFHPPEDQWAQEYFIGRQEEKESLLQALDQSNRIDVYGPLGIGKTTLVAALWHQSELASVFTDGMLWIRSPRVSPEEIADTLLLALRKPDLRIKPVAAQVAEIRKKLEGKRALIVLDEVTDRHEVDMALECIPTTCTLLTTRSHVRALEKVNGEVLVIESLPMEDAIEMFRARLDDRTRRYYSQVDGEVCSLLAHLPLAIELVSRSIAWSACPPRQALAQLRALRKRFEDDSDFALCAALAFSSSRLPNDLIELLNTLQALPGRRLSLSLVEAISEKHALDRLPVLLNLGLMRCDRLGYYPLTALSAMPDVWSLQGAIQTGGQLWSRLSEFLQDHLTENCQDFGRLQQVRDLLTWLTEYRSSQEAAAQTVLAFRLMLPFLRESGYWSDLEQLLCSGIRIATELADNEALAHFQHELALLCFRRRQDERAFELFQENLGLLRDLGDLPALSFALYAMGLSHERQGNLEDARSIYSQVLELPFRESPSFIHAVHRLGKLSLERNDPKAARHAFQIAYDASLQLLSGHSASATTSH